MDRTFSRRPSSNDQAFNEYGGIERLGKLYCSSSPRQIPIEQSSWHDTRTIEALDSQTAADCTTTCDCRSPTHKLGHGSATTLSFTSSVSIDSTQTLRVMSNPQSFQSPGITGEHESSSAGQPSMLKLHQNDGLEVEVNWGTSPLNIPISHWNSTE